MKTMIKRHILLIPAILLVVLLVAGCAGANPAVDLLDADGQSAGFWSGLLHGVISPVTFVISLFSDNVSVYEVFNTGNWYDFGFMFGVSLVLGGGAKGARKRKSK